MDSDELLGVTVIGHERRVKLGIWFDKQEQVILCIGCRHRDRVFVKQ
jgi:hypothetical protein